jgi:hypothetical protein
MYQKLGYAALEEGRFLPVMAEDLIRELGENQLEVEIATALKEVGTDKTYLSGLILPDLFKASSVKLAPGGEPYMKFMCILVKTLMKAGFITEDYKIMVYRTEPLLTIEEAVGNVLTAKIPWLTKEHLGGERATLGALRSMLPIQIRDLAATSRLRSEYYQNLRLKVGDIGYKILRGLPIDQFEKSFFLAAKNTEKGAPGQALALNMVKGTSQKQGQNGAFPIPAAPTESSLVASAYSELQAAVQPGPGLLYSKMMSNRNMESLVFYYGPHAPSLPISTGFTFSFGPFKRLKLQRLEEKMWSVSDQLTGIRDRFADLTSRQRATKPTAGAPKDTAVTLSADELEWNLNAAARVCGPPGTRCPEAFIDLPQVRLRVLDESDVSRIAWEYMSAWRQRVISSQTGGSVDMLYLDMALTNDTVGHGLVDSLNLDAGDIVILDKTVTDREVGNAPRDIFEDIFVVQAGGGLIKRTVRMTDYYSRHGNVMYRPAFAEFFLPPRAWYFQEDPTAIDFIVAALGLNREDAARNRLAITISHNDAVLKRIGTASAPFNVQSLIALILNVRPIEKQVSEKATT